MTEKRFYISSDSNQNIYDDILRCYYSSIDANKLCKLLNELNDKCEFLEIENEALEDGATKYAELYHQSLKENEQLKQSNERLLKMLDNIANYMQKQNKCMPIDDFVEWWNGIATKGLDDGEDVGSVYAVCDLLNELADEKEYCEEELLKLRRDNEQLKTTCDNLIMKNQQLKMEIMRLEMIIKTGEKKDEHIGWKRVDVE